jgi:hypothetical protein
MTWTNVDRVRCTATASALQLRTRFWQDRYWIGGSSSPDKISGLTYGRVLWHMQDASWIHLLTSAMCLFHNTSSTQKYATFCAFDDYGHTNYDDYYINHDNLDHNYIIGYLNVNIRLCLRRNIGNNSSLHHVRHHSHQCHSLCDYGGYQGSAGRPNEALFIIVSGRFMVRFDWKLPKWSYLGIPINGSFFPNIF